jgi:thioredoxin 1
MNQNYSNPVIEIPGSQFDREIHAARVPVLAHFYASWCEQCRILAPSLQQLSGEFADELTIIAVNLDRCPEVAARYSISKLPTLELFDNGVPIFIRRCGDVPAGDEGRTARPVGGLRQEKTGIKADPTRVLPCVG